ncbi:MAG: hypothetical protein JHC84_02100 [Solirubrobacteraceae bacterium]|nr:hypothetical protein [Solirubrobacteraceae bacterium]
MQSLVDAIHELAEIPPDELADVCDSWLDMLEGDYFDRGGYSPADLRREELFASFIRGVKVGLLSGDRRVTALAS